MEHNVKERHGVLEDRNPVLNIGDKETGIGCRSLKTDSTLDITVDESKLPDTVCAPAQPRPISSAEGCTPESSESSAALHEHQPFVCALCMFSAKGDKEFLKHTTKCHYSSYWCNACGRFFISASELVTHIKEDACEETEIVYQCGVTGCTFKTTSGQTFLSHVKDCRKGTTLMFCVQCQKMFSVASCLIMHMQNECPRKSKTLANPVQVSSDASTSANSNDVKKTAPNPVTQAVSVVTRAQSAMDGSHIANSISPEADRDERELQEKGSRGILKDTSGNDESIGEPHPSDPIWSPEEIPSSTSVSLNSLFSRNDDLDITPQQNESRVITKRTASCPEQNEALPLAVTCQICEFCTSSETLLEDHVREHRIPDKILCDVCSAVFKNHKEFIEHFQTMHKKEFVELDNSSTTTDVEVSSETFSVPISPDPLEDNTITKMDPHTRRNSENSGSVRKTEHESGIYKPKQRTSIPKEFEELKTPNSIVKMKEELKLKHFFKCMLWDCTFTTDNSNFFLSHLSENHSGQKLYCPFCFKEFTSPGSLINHMLLSHGKRCYQCSVCFYRAYSRGHVQIHIHHNHLNETAVVYKSTNHLSNGVPPSNEKEEATEETTWPYICATGDCEFKTFDPMDFRKHNEKSHRMVSIFICFYCRAEFLSLKRLMSHLPFHGMRRYHCTCCLHGSDIRSEVLVHVSQNHADKPLQILMRGPQEDSP